MMKITVFIAASVDGFIARSDGDVDWLHDPEHTDTDVDYGFDALMASVDALVMGRRTFEKVLTFGAWPYGATRVIVLSRRGVEVPVIAGAKLASTSLSPRELAAALEAEGVGHIYVDGGKTIQGFLAAGLVTDLVITRVPRLLGAGIPLFGALDHELPLRHVETTAYPKGLVTSRYVVVND